MYAQARTLTISSRSVCNNVLPDTAEFVADFLGYEQVGFASSGVEACEGAVKLARKWGHVVKGIPEDCA